MYPTPHKIQISSLHRLVRVVLKQGAVARATHVFVLISYESYLFLDILRLWVKMVGDGGYVELLLFRRKTQLPRHNLGILWRSVVRVGIGVLGRVGSAIEGVHLFFVRITTIGIH